MKKIIAFIVFSTISVNLQAQGDYNIPSAFPVESSFYNRTDSGIDSDAPPPNSPLPPPIKVSKSGISSQSINDTISFESDELTISPESAEFRTGALGENSDMFSQITTTDIKKVDFVPNDNYTLNNTEYLTKLETDNSSVLYWLFAGLIVIVVIFYLLGKKSTNSSQLSSVFYSFISLKNCSK